MNHPLLEPNSVSSGVGTGQARKANGGRSSHGLNTDGTRTKNEFLYDEITRKIIGGAFEVYKVLGYGFLESVYQKAMQAELRQQGLQCELERPIAVRYKGATVGEFRADLFVQGAVIVELKVARNYNSDDEPQLLNSLKATGVKVGLLVNFGRTKVEFERRVF